MSWVDNAYISGLPFTGSSNFATSMYVPVNAAVMYGPSGYSMDSGAAGRCYFYGWGDKIYMKMGSISSARHLWIQLTYPTAAS